MAANRSTYRERVRMPSRPMTGHSSSRDFGRPMAYGPNSKRPRRKRKIGRKILAVLVVGLVVWFGRHEIVGTVQGWLGQDSVADSTADAAQQGTADMQRKASQRQDVKTEPVATKAEAAGDSVSEAGLLSRAGDWMEDRLANVFQVKQIELSGERALPEHELMAGLDTLHGQPLLEIDPPSLADSLRLNPRIKSVDIGRQFPSTVSVRVEERREVAVLISNGGVWGIDESRVVLPLPGRAWPLDLPVVSGLAKDPVPGTTLTDPAVVAALDWVLAASETPRVQAWISELHLSGGKIAWIAGEDGRVVLPGTHATIAQVATLDAFLASGEQTEGRIVDLTFPDYLIVRDEPWSGTTATEG